MFFKDFGRSTAGKLQDGPGNAEWDSKHATYTCYPRPSPPTDLFNDDFSYKRKLKIKLPTPDGVVSARTRLISLARFAPPYAS